ncbi:MAG: DEAD/DEAH box helicase, partial [Deltaproteobacteria bacterium]|nr:DEAD/DEAH box helicase [Deltaproteobacteria bacterium]
MTKSLHPLETTDRIRDSYLRYLKTIYPFQDPDMRREFKRALEKPDMVVKGPLLESSPPFKTGRNIEQLMQDGVLHPDFRQLCSAALPLQRPLYLHQDQAISKVVQARRNLIVATGTGSGKTESFLIPIMNYLLQQRAQGKLSAGVRALLLYPMNALANDQLKRLRQILAEFPDITFGRYTGETKQKLKDAEDSFKDQFPREARIPNELISRDQMRDSPPHILLTNYAMLEYLLLRPEDNIFFDGEAAQFWRFIVLDEAHVYNGANGIEIAMLLRRLKDRVVKSERERLTCLATSATLGGDEADFPDAATFARNLFNEKFEWEQHDPDRQDVVQASRLTLSVLSNAWGEGSPELYQDLVDLLQTEEKTLSDLIKIVENYQLPSKVIKAIRQVSRKSKNAINAALYHLLRGDERLHHLHEALAGEPQFLTELSPLIFPNETGADEKLINLVELAARARPDSDSLSLLPARYHLFARALEGAFACLDPDKHPHSEARLYLSRQETCPHCSQKVFELATCTRCGTAYIVGEFKRDELSGLTHLIQNSAAIGKTSYFVLDSRIAGLDEDEAVVTKDDLTALADDSIEAYTLCRQCGVIERG